MDYDVIVVGGGAAGLMAACTAAERGRKVLLLEKMDQAGRKLRITGKGRCNLTNTNPLRDTLPHIGSSTAGATTNPASRAAYGCATPTGASSRRNSWSGLSAMVWS